MKNTSQPSTQKVDFEIIEKFAILPKFNTIKYVNHEVLNLETFENEYAAAWKFT